MANVLPRLSLRARLCVAAVLGVSTASAGWKVAIGPLRVEIAADRARLVRLRAEAQSAEFAGLRLRALQQETRVLEESGSPEGRKRLEAGEHEKADHHDLRMLNDLAREAGLTLVSFKPRAAEVKEGLAVRIIELGFEGGYHDLRRFLGRMAETTGITSVSELQIKGTGSSGPATISARLIAAAYDHP